MYGLTSPQKPTRRLIMQKARRHPSEDGLRPLVSVRFQVLFTPLSGFFSSFSRLTGSLSVVQEYLAFRGGPRSFTRSSTSSALLWYPDEGSNVSHTGLSPAMVGLSRPFCYVDLCNLVCPGPQPRDESRFGLVPFRSPLLGKSMSLSSPTGT